MKNFYRTKKVLIAQIAIVCVQLALLRSLTTCIYVLNKGLTLANELNMFLRGSLVAAVAITLLTALYFWKKYGWVTLAALVTVLILIAIKVHYMGWSA